MRYFIVLFLVIWSLVAQAAPRSPEEALQQYYSWLLSKRKATLPNIDEQRRLAPLLSPTLRRLISEVGQAQKQCFEAVKGTTDKPYFFESDIFSGNGTSPDEVAYGDIAPKDGGATVAVTHVSVNPRLPKGSLDRVEVWVVKVEMRLHEGSWQISDLQFADGGTLTSSFSSYLANSKAWCRH